MNFIVRILNFILGNCVVIACSIFIIFLIGLVSFLVVSRSNYEDYFCKNYPSKGEKTKGVVIDFRTRANQLNYYRYEVKINGMTDVGNISKYTPGYDTIEINDTVPVYYFPDKVGDDPIKNYFHYEGVYKDMCN
jgi:hypothetical protein